MLPPGVEGLTFHRLPASEVGKSPACVSCGHLIEDENCFGVPGEGCYHAACWPA